jgi:hypothetical protein
MKNPIQQNIFDGFMVSRMAEVVRLLTLAKEANDAIVKLPATGANGEPVVHRDNKDMMGIRDTYIQMAQAMRMQLDRFDEMTLEREFRFSFNQGKFEYEK